MKEFKVTFRSGSKKKCLECFAEALQFPDYFGHNWDAFEECINDLGWLPKNSKISIVLGRHALPKQDQTILLDILKLARKQNANISCELV